MNPYLERKPWRGQENINFRLTVTGGAWCLLVSLHASPRKKNLTISFGVRRSTLRQPFFFLFLFFFFFLLSTHGRNSQRKTSAIWRYLCYCKRCETFPQWLHLHASILVGWVNVAASKRQRSPIESQKSRFPEYASGLSRIDGLSMCKGGSHLLLIIHG